MISRHWLKIFSVFFAILLWAYVVSSLPQNLVRTIPVDFLLSDNVGLVSASSKEVTLSIRGPRAYLYQFKKQVLHIPLDLRQLQGPHDYPHDIPINLQSLPLPNGIEAKVIHPQNIRVRLAKKIKKKLAVRPTLTGELGANLSLENLEVIPSEVTVSGPEKELGQMEFIALEAYDRALMQGPGEVELGHTLDTTIYKISSSGRFKLKYDVRAKSANVTLKKIKIRFSSTRQIVQSSEEVASVEVFVQEKDRTIKKDQVKIVAFVAKDKPGSYEVDLKAELPDGVHLVEIFPKKIKVTIK